jgi:hypothetical protein
MGFRVGFVTLNTEKMNRAELIDGGLLGSLPNRARMYSEPVVPRTDGFTAAERNSAVTSCDF